jgi:uncharacterized protein (UPF0179 family)
MPSERVKVTLIGTRLARPDLEFVYNGGLKDCEGCKAYHVCNNLLPGKRYRVIGIRSSTRHDCPIHEGGVLAVEVIASPIISLIPAERAIMNSTIVPDILCSQRTCKSFDLCHPEGILEGERYMVGEVLGNAPEGCEKGKNLKLVELRPI